MPHVRPAPLTARLREIGTRWQQDIRAAGDRTKALYEPLLAAACAVPDGVQCERDVAYGPHPRQVLDVYRTAGARQAPVIVFVHGGAFVRGAKDTSEQMWGNVLRWFARQGCVGVNVEYRLAHEAPHPGGAQDVALACDWVARNIEAHGGDPRRVCLIGHSAGGTHAAAYACDPLLGLAPRIRALVLVSARLRADVRPDNPNADGVRAYYGGNEGALERLSPTAHAASLRLPLLVVNAQYENPWLDVYGLEFALLVARARGQAPLHIAMADHNHISVMAHFNSGESWLGEQILDFFAQA
ncbi:alpha/beta hydrolase [Variovorax sp.]|uniref:alpha/beta hydrolase n=1 Tax=Variovorax sp. TaxID=1871043 RepID=UPI0039C9F2FD